MTTQHRKTRINIHALSGTQTHDIRVQEIKAFASDLAATGTVAYLKCCPKIALEEMEDITIAGLWTVSRARTPQTQNRIADHCPRLFSLLSAHRAILVLLIYGR
jgi:hypothetical protein